MEGEVTDLLLEKRFAELVEQLAAVEATKQHRQSDMTSGDYVDNALLLNWKVKAKNLLSRACGEQSEHYRGFVDCEQGSFYSTNYQIMLRLKAVFEAAKEDFEGGYLNTVRNLVQSEVFSNELDQARELFGHGYLVAAAVIAGVVLETTMRQLCTDRDIAIGKLDKMNADLAKHGLYSVLVQKHITAVADIRNSAAHGHPEKFTKDDVSRMIDYVEGFVATHL